MRRRFRKRIWELARAKDGFTLPLYFTWVNVTFGVIMLGIVLWAASAVVAHRDLRGVAQDVANAAEAQVSQSYTGSNTGYAQSVWSMDPSQAQSAAQTMWQTELSNTRLTTEFSNLQMNLSVQNNVVTVTVTGTYLPLFLSGLAKRFPSIVPSVTIPMSVQVTNDYPVLGR